MDNIKDFINFSELNEDGGGMNGAPSGVASSNGGNVGGMGNVVSAQPSSVPGATVTGDGTTGSGDYGNISFPSKYKDSTYTKNTGVTGNKMTKLSKGKNRKDNKFINDVKEIIKDKKPSSKVMSFDNFNKDTIEKVTKVKQ